MSYMIAAYLLGILTALIGIYLCQERRRLKDRLGYRRSSWYRARRG